MPSMCRFLSPSTWDWTALGTIAIAGFTLALYIVGTRQWRTMQRQLDEMVVEKRPWLEVIPELDRHIHFSTFLNRRHIHIPVTCKAANYGQSPARNVLCMTRIDSVPYVMDNKVMAENDARLKTLCSETAAFSAKNPEAGIPVFQNKNPISIFQVSENIDMKYFSLNDTIYMVQGCLDYTYAEGRHGQTTFRYLVGKFSLDKTLHGIPFINGEPTAENPELSRATWDASNVDFVKTDGGNYAK